MYAFIFDLSHPRNVQLDKMRYTLFSLLIAMMSLLMLPIHRLRVIECYPTLLAMKTCLRTHDV